jgi:ParB/RepB/Spo0J family partition protein
MTTTEAPTIETRTIPIGRIFPDPLNPRNDVGDTTDLLDEIRAFGIIQNIVVRPDWSRPNFDGEPEQWLIIAGERRWTCANALDYTELTCTVRNDLTAEDATVLGMMLAENGPGRHGLKPLEEADGYFKLTELGVTQRNMKAKTGRSQSHISKRLGLRKLPDRAKQLLERGTMNVTTAEVWLDLNKKDASAAAEVLEYAVSRGDIADRDISREVLHRLDVVKVTKLRAKLTDRNLKDLGASPYQAKMDGYEECGETDAKVKAFTIDNNAIVTYWRKQARKAPAPRPAVVDDETAVEARARRDARHQQRKDIIANLVDDDRPDDTAVFEHVCRTLIYDHCAQQWPTMLAALLGLEAETPSEADATVVEYAQRGAVELQRTAWAVALMGALHVDEVYDNDSDPAAQWSDREMFRLLDAHGYELDAEQRRFVYGIEDTPDVATIDGAIENERDDSLGIPTDLETIADVATTLVPVSKLDQIIEWVRGADDGYPPEPGWEDRARIALQVERDAPKRKPKRRPRSDVVALLEEIIEQGFLVTYDDEDIDLDHGIAGNNADKRDELGLYYELWAISSGTPTKDATLAWVDDRPDGLEQIAWNALNKNRACSALVHERARDKPRPTVIKALQLVLARYGTPACTRCALPLHEETKDGFMYRGCPRHPTEDTLEEPEIDDIGLDVVVECRICGCTDDNNCDGGCTWVGDPTIDPICSTCIAKTDTEEVNDARLTETTDAPNDLDVSVVEQEAAPDPTPEQAGEHPGDGAAPTPEPPWARYDNHPASLIAKTIENVEEPRRLLVGRAYEIANKNRDVIVEAFNKRIDELGIEV